MEFKPKEWDNPKADKEVRFKARKKNVIKETFGSLKKWKIDAQRLKEELREEWK